jgi:hypothetical protein
MQQCLLPTFSLHHESILASKRLVSWMFNKYYQGGYFEEETR